MAHGANMAIIVGIEWSPEVMAFRKAHNIGPVGNGFLLPGSCGSEDKPIVYGRLKDVTVKEALDYIFQTFPGFWIYENCVNDKGEQLMSVIGSGC